MLQQIIPCHFSLQKYFWELFLTHFWLVQCSLQNKQSFVLQNFLCFYSSSFHVNCFVGRFFFFCNVWSMIKSFPKCCLICHEAFSFEISFHKKNSFFFCNLESLPVKVFSNIFVGILFPKPFNYDPWNSLLFSQFPNYLINKTIVLSNQQLVTFYENISSGLCDLEKFSKQWDLCATAFFETPCIALCFL